MAQRWAHRKDLLRRFVEGKFGFQSKGRAVTPEWNDDLHLAQGLQPVQGLPLKLMWDGGLNPTCVISQITPLGDWLILDAFVGEDYGMYELIRDVVRPRLLERYPWIKTIQRGVESTGDPNLDMREQSRSRTADGRQNSAVTVILNEVGGTWTKGPVDEASRIEALREVLRKTRDGRGIVMVDRDNAEPVWFALRGGWHYRISRTGVIGSIVKDEHSHPGDCMGYGAARWFPQGKLATRGKTVEARVGSYYNAAPGVKKPFIGRGTGDNLPTEARSSGQRERPRKLCGNCHANRYRQPVQRRNARSGRHERGHRDRQVQGRHGADRAHRLDDHGDRAGVERQDELGNGPFAPAEHRRGGGGRWRGWRPRCARGDNGRRRDVARARAVAASRHVQRRRDDRLHRQRAVGARVIAHGKLARA